MVSLYFLCIPPHLLPGVGVPHVNDCVQISRPQRKFILPRGHCWEGHDNQEGTVNVVQMEQWGEKADGLNGLAEAHFVGQNAAVVPWKVKEKKQNFENNGMINKLTLTRHRAASSVPATDSHATPAPDHLAAGNPALCPTFEISGVFYRPKTAREMCYKHRVFSSSFGLDMSFAEQFWPFVFDGTR